MMRPLPTKKAAGWPLIQNNFSKTSVQSEMVFYPRNAQGEILLCTF